VPSAILCADAPGGSVTTFWSIHSAIIWPWFSTRQKTQIAQLHRLALSGEWRDETPSLGRALLWISGLTWPVRAPLLCAWALRRNGAGSRRLFQRYLDLLWLALRHNLPPTSYYVFRLFESAEVRRRAASYLHGFELQPLFVYVNGARRVPEVDDKDRFYQSFRDRGVPTCPPVVTFRRGEPEWSNRSTTRTRRSRH